jgi:hypothetical protein
MIRVEITRLRDELEPTIKGLSGALEKVRQRRGKRIVVGASRGITQWVLCSLPGYWNEFGGGGKEQIMTVDPELGFIHLMPRFFFTPEPTEGHRLGQMPLLVISAIISDEILYFLFIL